MKGFLSKELEEVWEKLGFSISQKLEMVVRYTSDMSQSAKLSEALQYWKSALRAVTAYDQAYSNLKDWLRFEADERNIDQRKRAFNVLAGDLNFGEKRVREQIEVLQKRYGDTLIYRQKVA